ncbi:UNVERIFIED_CONTAM: hypothetical protein FKN15_075589, partial [Acipenser sinensis]
DCSNLARKRLFKAESEIQLLKSQITKEKVLWEGRFQELRRKQRELKEQTESLKEEEPNSYDCSNLARKRLFKAESEIQLLKSQITKEKVLWEGRFQELRRKQRELKEQFMTMTFLCHKKALGTHGILLGSPRSSSKPNRVFVPHSHLDLRIGHRVRVLLPSGRINTGIVRFLGYLNGMQDFCLGVELETPEYGQHDGVYEGQCYFHCKPGHGVFVSFNKLLMAWE